jgi:hypothetical protein
LKGEAVEGAENIEAQLYLIQRMKVSNGQNQRNKNLEAGG